AIAVESVQSFSGAEPEEAVRVSIDAGHAIVCEAVGDRVGADRQVLGAHADRQGKQQPERQKGALHPRIQSKLHEGMLSSSPSFKVPTSGRQNEPPRRQGLKRKALGVLAVDSARESWAISLSWLA